MSGTILSVAQSRRLEQFVELFYEEARSSVVAPRSLVQAIAILNSGLHRGIRLDHGDLLLLKWMLDFFFNIHPDFADKDLQSAYYKLFDAWPVEPPWFALQGFRWPI